MAGVGVAARAEAEDPEALIRQGIEYRRADRNVEALKAFQQAYDVQKTPRALAQIGLAEQALGRWGAADRHLRGAIESPRDPWIRKNRGAIDDALKVIAGRVGRLDVAGTPVGAEIRVDGEVIGNLPLAAPVSVTAGGVAIEVRAPGHLPIVRAATVSVGTLVRESFNLQSVSPEPEPARNAASQPGPGGPMTGANPGSTGAPPAVTAPGGNTPGPTGASSVDSSNDAEASAADMSGAPPDGPPGGTGASVRSVVTLGIAGLAVASVVVGIVEHVSWQKKVTSFGNMVGCDSRLETKGGAGCQDLYNDGESAKKLALVAYGVGAGLAATAAILYFTRPARDAEPGKIACAMNPSTLGVGCALQF